MKPISRLSSGRVVVTSPGQVAEDRYQLLDLASAEPNLGTAANGAVLTTNTAGQRIFTKNLQVDNVDVSNNLVAERVYTDNLLFANGDPYTTETTESNIYNGNITVGTTVTLVDTVSAAGVSSVRWAVTAKDAVNGTLRASTIDSVNNGSAVYYNEYGVVLSDNDYEVAVFTSNITDGSINLYALGESAEVTVTYQRTTLGTSTVPGYISGAGYIQNVVGSGTATTCVVDSFVGTGTQVNYTLSATPTDADQVIAVVAGIVQPKSVYTVSGSVLTFSAAPDLNVPVEFTTFVTTTITGYTGSAGAAGTTGATGAIGYTGSAGAFSGSVSGNLSVSGTTFVTGDILPTSNNTVNIGSATNRFGTLYLAANTIDLGGTTISTTPNGDLAFVTSSGTIDITANTVNFLSTVATTAVEPGATVAPVAAIYATVAELPASAATGTLAFVTAVSRLFIYNGTAWINTAPATKNFFYILQTGSFTGPITGNVGYTPIGTITLSSLEASVAQAGVANIVFSVMKNGTTLQSFTLLAGQTSLESDFGNNVITTADTVTMNIVSGSGQDLAVRFIYT
jgi:hypothetical protein